LGLAKETPVVLMKVQNNPDKQTTGIDVINRLKALGYVTERVDPGISGRKGYRAKTPGLVGRLQEQNDRRAADRSARPGEDSPAGNGTGRKDRPVLSCQTR